MAKRPGILGENLRRLRKAFRPKLTQKALAAKAGRSRQTIAQVECGMRESVDLDTLVDLAAALGVRTDDLVGEASGVAPVEPLLAEFLKSPYGQITKPTPEELAWLRELPGLFWVSAPPSPESLHHLILAYRARRP